MEVLQLVACSSFKVACNWVSRTALDDRRANSCLHGRKCIMGYDANNSRLAAQSFQNQKVSISRRDSLVFMTSIQFAFSFQAKANGEEELLSLERYSDKKDGFTLLKPVNWNKVDKAGANVLFEDPNARVNNLGVVVSPVRISSLKDFDSPQNVADKLLEAERKKASTNSVQLVRVGERSINESKPVYEFEYLLDSTRGMKRVFSAVTVASRKLYLMNIVYAEDPDRPIMPQIQNVLEEMLHSFDTLN